MIDLADPQAQILQRLAETPHSRLVVIWWGKKDMPLGIILQRVYWPACWGSSLWSWRA